MATRSTSDTSTDTASTDTAASTDTTTSTDSTPTESLGFARVQDPNGPDDLGANNTGRVGDAREYDAERLALMNTLSRTGSDGFGPGDTASDDVYQTEDGALHYGNRPEGRSVNVVARGDVVNPAVAALIARG